jgi:hypothetical protein
VGWNVGVSVAKPQRTVRKVKSNIGSDHLYIGKDADGAAHVFVVDSK